MKKFILLSLLILSTEVHSAKQLSAHVHGSVGLDIAAEGNKVLIMLKSPTDSFFGFEYKAKTAKEKALVKSVKNTWMKNLRTLFGDDSMEDCTQENTKWNLKYEGSHSEILAESYLNCKSKVAGRSLVISLKDKYPRINEIHLQLLRSDGSALDKKIKSKTFKINL